MSKKTLIVIVVVLAVILAACAAAIVVLPMLTSSQQGDQLDSAAVDQASEAVQPDDAEPSATDGEEAPVDIPDDYEEYDWDDAQGNDQSGETVKESTGAAADDTAISDSPKDVTVPDSDEVTYESYQAMTGEEQMAFMESFESMEAFFAWFNAVKEEYEENLIVIDGSTPIDLEELLGGN